MPTWNICCDNDACDFTDTLSCVSWRDRDAAMPMHCAAKMVVDYRGQKHGTQTFESYVTKNIHPEGKPIKVLNSAHLRSLETEYGVRRMDDPGLVARGNELVHERQHGKRTYI